MPGKKPDQMTEEELKIAVQRKFERERELDPVERERSDEMKAELRQQLNIWEELQRFCENQWHLIDKVPSSKSEQMVVEKSTVLKFICNEINQAHITEEGWTADG